ncbi:hypothetical protein [Methanoculleus sp.]|uniref:hypothetical protein n=1 Tax=Methanoculleus sp. TaxID=90427 RepID=UPI0025CF477F|nr:hypothetical protein [Methanoculleus sp.]
MTAATWLQAEQRFGKEEESYPGYSVPVVFLAVGATNPAKLPVWSGVLLTMVARTSMKNSSKLHIAIAFVKYQNTLGRSGSSR